MPAASALDRAVYRERRRVAQRERAATARIDRSYKVALRAYRADLAEAQEVIAAKRASGEDVSNGLLFRERRLQLLVDQAERAAQITADAAKVAIQQQGALTIQDAQDDLRRQIIAGMGPGPDNAVLSFATMPAEALNELTAQLGPGSPTAALLDDLAGEARERAEDELIAGLARGDSPRVIGRKLTGILNVTRDRADLIAQETIFRAHRKARSESLKANRNLLKGWIWSAAMDGRTCFPADVVVSGPRPLASSARDYVGELVVLTIADREQLSVTPNHPILTRRGWIAAELVVEGDDVLGCSGSENDLSRRIGVDNYQVPTSIKDVANTLGMVSVEMPVAPPDFHGDWGESDVCVVRTDGLLRDRQPVHRRQHLDQFDLSTRHVHPISNGSDRLALLCSQDSAIEGNLSLTSTIAVDDSTLPYWLGRNSKRLGHIQTTAGNARSPERRGNGTPRNTKAGRQAILGLAASVSRDDFGIGQAQLSMLNSTALRASNDSTLTVASEQIPALELSGEPLGTYAEVRTDALRTLAGHVGCYRVLHVGRRSFRGHVFNLHTEPNWYLANGIVVANCVICYAMHGTEHSVDEELHSHVRCRCSQRPKTKSWAELGFPGVTEPPEQLLPTGVRLFEMLDITEQRRILGPAALAAYDAGEVNLPDFVQKTRHPEWGQGKRRRSLDDAIAAGGKRRRGRAATPRPVRRGPSGDRDALVSVTVGQREAA